ncbi:MAG: hypothetical protein QE271_00645 [Bacteriovoracaceae bacterium]|nr:hypothetical protein [Bacteriovoracaceae bacterium]
MKHINAGKLTLTLTLASLFVLAGNAFAQKSQEAEVNTRNFVDNIKCRILGLDYKHFVYLSVAADKNSYNVGEASNQNASNPFKNYTQVESNVEATAVSTIKNVSTLTGEGTELFSAITSNWSFQGTGTGFNLEATITTEADAPYSSGSGKVKFNSKLNSAIKSTKSYTVDCSYVN